MVATSAACPNVQKYEQLLEGHLPFAEAERLAAHLESCSRCADAFSTLQSHDTLLEAARGAEPVRLGEDETDAGRRLLEGLFKLRATEPVTQGDGATAPAAQASPDSYDFLAPAQAADEIGRLGAYRVLKVLGTGGMGVVFLAEDPQLKRRVALKVMKPSLAASDSARKRFLREAQATAAI